MKERLVAIVEIVELGIGLLLIYVLFFVGRIYKRINGFFRPHLKRTKEATEAIAK
jgi:hypothetical protein